MLIFISSISDSVLAEEVKSGCMKQAIEENQIDFITNLRNKADFKIGELEYEEVEAGEFKNGSFLTKFDEEKNKVNYKSTIVALVTNNSNGKEVLSISQCELSFKIDTCELITKLCSGI